MSDSPFKFNTTCDPTVPLDSRCSYCGSISPLKAIELLKTPGTRFSGADFKYGWPHKFYLNDLKIYNNHLSQLSDQQLQEYSRLTKAVLGIEFQRDEKGIKWRAPESNSAYGYQLWGVIGPDGKPDHSLMNPTPKDTSSDVQQT